MSLTRILLSAGVLFSAASTIQAQDPVLTFGPTMPLELQVGFDVIVEGEPGDIVFGLFSTRLAPFKTPFGIFGIDPKQGYIAGLGRIGQDGFLRSGCGAGSCDLAMTRDIFYAQVVTFSTHRPWTVRGLSEVVTVDFVTGETCPPCADEAPVDLDVWDCGSQPETAFYMPGCPNKRFRWVTQGLFVEFPDGTAHLTGEIRQVDDNDNRFDVDLRFFGRQSLAQSDGPFPPPMSPKLDCVKTEALLDNGGTFDTSEWHYYMGIEGTMTGQRDFAGTNFDVELRGPAAQIGFGGALKNNRFGLSAWIQFTRTSGSSCRSSIGGDVNINLDECLTAGR